MTVRALLTLVLVLLASTVVADQMPQDVAEFLRRIELCVHFREEPWPEGNSAEDAERREFIVKQIEQFCADLSEESRNLRDKYLGRLSVLNELNKVIEWEEE